MINYCNVLIVFLNKNYHIEFLSMIIIQGDMSLSLLILIINLQGAPSLRLVTNYTL